MAFKVVDMVAMAGTVTGTDDVALGAALDGFRTLAAAGVVGDDLLPYRLASADGALWETGIGVYYEIGGAPYFTRVANGSYAVFGTAVACELYICAPSWMHLAVNTADGAAPRANNMESIAFGGGAVAGADGAIAGGGASSATGINSVALGRRATAQHDGSVAIGEDTVVAGCAALARGSRADNTDHSGVLIWTGYTSAGAALDVAGDRFSLPNVPCIALLDVLIAGATTAFADTYAARCTVVLKRTAVNATIEIEGTPSVTVIKDDAGSVAPSFLIFSTGASSALRVELGGGMSFNATIVASLVQV